MHSSDSFNQLFGKCLGFCLLYVVSRIMHVKEYFQVPNKTNIIQRLEGEKIVA